MPKYTFTSIVAGREVRKRLRERKVESGQSKEREGEGSGSFEEEMRGETEEKKGLKEKREEDKGGKERIVLEEEMRDLRYGSVSWSWRIGFKSIRRTIRWVLL